MVSCSCTVLCHGGIGGGGDDLRGRADKGWVGVVVTGRSRLLVGKRLLDTSVSKNQNTIILILNFVLQLPR